MEGLWGSLEGLWGRWEGLGATWEGLRVSLEGLGTSWEGHEASWEGLRASPEAHRGEGRNKEKRKKESTKSFWYVVLPKVIDPYRAASQYKLVVFIVVAIFFSFLSSIPQRVALADWKKVIKF